jgi:hypothetical protein
MIKLEKENLCYIVWQDDLRIGTVSLYDNPGHMGNRYVKLALDRYDKSISAELFRLLREITGRPLQAMIESDNTEQVRFLIAGGFVCKRKCYEVEASAEDYVGEQSNVPLSNTKKGEGLYNRCCEILFDHYVETHRAVNPWTAGYEAFLENLPETVVYQERDGRITALAFVEENEIAFVCSVDKPGFADFAASLITEMFERHETIFFESDDCDWPAMAMKSMFANLGNRSFDTYILDDGVCV